MTREETATLTSWMKSPKLWIFRHGVHFINIYMKMENLKSFSVDYKKKLIKLLSTLPGGPFIILL